MTATADQEAVPLATIESVPLQPCCASWTTRATTSRPRCSSSSSEPVSGLQGTTAAGAAVISELLTEQEIPTSGVRIADGSGLSRLDRLTTQAVVAMLRSGWLDQDLREILISSLPVAGRSGTLDSRMRGTVAAGRVRAKTGTLNEASALSGYVRRRYAFSVIQNGSPLSIYWARRAQDRFATVLAAQ